MNQAMAATVRRHDPDRFLTALFAPPDKRDTLLTLYAFNHELARAREVVSQPPLALIRLQWWREVVEGAQRRHEVAEPLRAAIDRGELSANDLLALIEAREIEAEPSVETLDAWRGYLLASAGGLAVTAARLLRAPDPEALRPLGAAYGAAGVLRSIAVLARQHRCLLPNDVLANHGLSPEAVIAQPLLAGFGLATNERFIRIAKRNAQITDMVFKQQVVATVTQVENIYWDLVNAYELEQINERSLGFANKTLSDDQKQLELKAIPAMQVMTDQSVVATAEGNLTVARASLRLNELQMKNVLTKVDDPAIDEMPVVPLDLKAEPDPNGDKSMDDLIAEAEKKRPEVAVYQMTAEKEKQSLKDINSELLPSLNVYGLYAGVGTAGPKNPICSEGAACNTNLPTDFPSMFVNTFNYSSPEYQFGMTLSINLRNRQAKADQFRAVLDYRQSQISFEQQKKNILFDVRNSKFALEQDQARVEAAQKAKDLAQRTFDITKQEQQLGAKSSADTLLAENALAVAESALDTAQTQFEKAKADIDRAIGETLERTGVSIDDAKLGVVTHAP